MVMTTHDQLPRVSVFANVCATSDQEHGSGIDSREIARKYEQTSNWVSALADAQTDHQAVLPAGDQEHWWGVTVSVLNGAIVCMLDGLVRAFDPADVQEQDSDDDQIGVHGGGGGGVIRDFGHCPGSDPPHGTDQVSPSALSTHAAEDSEARDDQQATPEESVPDQTLSNIDEQEVMSRPADPEVPSPGLILRQHQSVPAGSTFLRSRRSSTSGVMSRSSTDPTPERPASIFLKTRRRSDSDAVTPTASNNTSSAAARRRPAVAAVVLQPCADVADGRPPLAPPKPSSVSQQFSAAMRVMPRRSLDATAADASRASWVERTAAEQIIQKTDLMRVGKRLDLEAELTSAKPVARQPDGSLRPDEVSGDRVWHRRSAFQRLTSWKSK